MKLFNKLGFSIPEVLISAGLISAGAVVMMKMTSNTTKSIKTNESRSEIVSIVGEIRGILSSPDACNNSFPTKNVSSSAIDIIKNSSGDDKFKVNKKIGNVKIVAMSLNDSDSPVDASSIGETNLQISFNKGRGTYEKNITKKIKLWVEVDASKNITKCRALSSGEVNVWDRSTVNADNIYYDNGFVAIGKADATVALDVVGDTKLTGSFDIIGKSNFSGDVEIVGNTNIAEKLDVSKSIKVGNSTARCTNSIKGTFRFRDSVKTLQICDGDDWKSLVYKNPTNLSGIECRTEIRRARSSTIIVTCPRGFQVTGCTAGCSGGTNDFDLAVNTSSNRCSLDDDNCAGSDPVRNVRAICCRVNP